MSAVEGSPPYQHMSATESPPAPSSAVAAIPERWYRQRWLRLLTVRVLVRVLTVSIFLILVKTGIIPFGEWLHAYLDWIDSLSPALALFTFAVCSIPFSAFTPGSYAPTVVAGATFPLYIAFPLSYICINASAMLNHVVVRHGRCCVWMKARMMSRMEQRGDINPSTLDTLLMHPELLLFLILSLRSTPLHRQLRRFPTWVAVVRTSRWTGAFPR
jgi:hypothetical protein